MNAFIANKRSRRGSRFGFVKVSNKKDATMAIERLNGRNAYGSRISVVTAKFNNIPIAGERVKKDKGEVRTSNKQVQKGPSKETIWERDESSKNEIKGRKRIMARVETEELWKMRRCLVGRMLSVCSTRTIELRLQAWGLGEIKVHRLGGKTFLISIDDEDMFLMLEDLQWSYLKEIFLDVKPCSESLVQKERATWLELSGIPTHCWNNTTLRRLADLWGNFEAAGENVAHTRDCEKVTILITTEIPNKIEEVVEICVGDMVYPVRVIEVGFKDNLVDSHRGKTMINSRRDKEQLRDDSDTESSSDPMEKMAPTSSNGEGPEMRSVEKDGSFIEPSFGNEYGEMPDIEKEAGR
ncbi:hypothetical protein V6N13_088860 [Hibiscus sabdariffa]